MEAVQLWKKIAGKGDGSSSHGRPWIKKFVFYIFCLSVTDFSSFTVLSSSIRWKHSQAITTWIIITSSSGSEFSLLGSIDSIENVRYHGLPVFPKVSEILLHLNSYLY